MADPSWAMKGELVLSCNCTVFCPCVLSLGNHPPTEGYCQTWAGFRIDAGHFGDVDLSGLNLARLLVDGEQVVVGQPPPAGVLASAVPTAGAPGGPLVNLNTAGQAELEALPEVGPVTAQAIMAWREEHGGFTSVDELLEVDGIGDATLGQLAPLVTV